MTVTEKCHEGSRDRAAGRGLEYHDMVVAREDVVDLAAQRAGELGQSAIPANSLTDVGEPGGRSAFVRWCRWQAKTADGLRPRSKAETRSDGSAAVAVILSSMSSVRLCRLILR
jgi:hypothetical protein